MTRGNKGERLLKRIKGGLWPRSFDHFSLHSRNDDTENNLSPPTSKIPTGDKAPHFTEFLTAYLVYEVAHNSDITTLVLVFSKTRD